VQFQLKRILWVIWAGFLGYLIALLGQGVWTFILTINLASSPAIPWAVFIMVPVICLIWLYLGGRGWPRSTSETRRRRLRANPVPPPVFAWALLAGMLSIGALAMCWIVMARTVRMPGNVLPAMSGLPLLTAVLAVAMGALISPILEQAGFWGYCLVMLEEKYTGVVAILITSLIYALGPHSPMGSPWWPRLVFYFLAGLTFSVMSHLTNSLLPGLLVHILGILSFFVLVWPHDATRPLVGVSGVDMGFWVNIGLAVILTVLAVLAFTRLAKLAKQQSPH
jgi:membrane protease YdiL (CAAX protease family)